MDSRGITALLSLGVLFGVLGGAVAFLRSYEGYGHFPGIPKRKKIRMSLEYAIFAFGIIFISIFIIFLLYYEGVM